MTSKRKGICYFIYNRIACFQICIEMENIIHEYYIEL